MGGDRTWRFDCITVGRFHQPPAQSKETNRQTNLSSSLISVSMSNVYLKPEQPPPSTETRRKLSLSSANILWSCYNTINSMFSSVPHNCKLRSGILQANESFIEFGGRVSEWNLVSKQQLFKIFSMHTCSYNLKNVEILLKFHAF